mgnify:CR=1 FL=1
MAYRFNGVECDTFEELQRIQGSARTTSAVVKETRKETHEQKVQGHASTCDCNRCEDLATKHAHSSFAG